MSRALRLLVADGWYHVTARGNERRAIFRGDGDCTQFLEMLGQLPERYGVRVAAYGLMGNHYHLILQTPRANLSAAMQWLNVGYSVGFNRRHRRTGHLLQGRFKAILVDGEGAWLGALAEYVHLNPVRVASLGRGKAERAAARAGLAPAPTPEEVARRLTTLRDHRWSSYPAYAGYAKAPEWLSTDEILRRAPGQEKDPHVRYRRRIENLIREGIPESPWSQLRAQVAIGAEKFWKALVARGGDRWEMTAVRRMERRTEWEDVVRAVGKVKEEAWEAFRDRHGDWGRDLALAVARRRCGMTLASLGLAAGGMRYGAVAAAVRNLEARLPRDRRLRAAWKKVMYAINT